MSSSENSLWIFNTVPYGNVTGEVIISGGMPVSGPWRRDGRVEESPWNAFRFKKGDINRVGNLEDVMINYYQMWVSSPKWITRLDVENRIVRNIVDNCFIHDLSSFFHCSCNVRIGCAKYNRVSHCELSDNDYCGVSAGWSWTLTEPAPHHHNIIEENHIHHITFLNAASVPVNYGVSGQ
jgi:hypothetical protein